jgi:PTS system ascorbate-specific IIA component
MIGILIIAHGTMGESLIHCVSHVFGSRQPQLAQLGVTVHDEPNALLPQARELVRMLDDGSGVLVLSDIYGATPCNIACHLIEPGKVDVVSGVNLPMLVRALTYRNEPLETVVGKAISGGCEGVLQISQEACRVATGH